MIVDFKPSDVVLHPVPFVGTMGRSESEQAAAVIIRILQLRDDTWEPLTPEQYGAILDKNEQDKLLKMWGLCPFFRPDFKAIQETGYVEEVTVTSVGPTRITGTRFTVAAFKALRPYVAKAAAT